jgi:hypothetical protein
MNYSIFRKTNQYDDTPTLMRIFYRANKYIPSLDVGQQDLRPFVGLAENPFTLAHCYLIMRLWFHVEPTSWELSRFKTIMAIIFARCSNVTTWWSGMEKQVAYEYKNTNYTTPIGIATYSPGVFLEWAACKPHVEDYAGDRVCVSSILLDDILFDEFLACWLAVPTYEEIRSYIPLPGEIVDKIFSYT